MKKLLIYGISLAILSCALVLGYNYTQGRLNPKQPTLLPSRLENCQNLEINDPKLIVFANKCLIEAGGRISDYVPDKIKRYTEAEKKRIKLKFELDLPDEWVVFYRSRKGYVGGTYLVRINPITCECIVGETP